MSHMLFNTDASRLLQGSRKLISMDQYFKNCLQTGSQKAFCHCNRFFLISTATAPCTQKTRQRAGVV